MKTAILFGFTVLTMSLTAQAETTCIGKVGNLNTRINILEDGINNVEIRQEGLDEFIGHFTMDKQRVIRGIATAKENGEKLTFRMINLWSEKNRSLSMTLKLINERGYVDRGVLQCVTLD